MVNGNLAYKHDIVTHPIRHNRPYNRGNYNNPYHQTRVKQNANIRYQHTVAKPVHKAQTANTFEKDKREMIHRKTTLLRIVYMATIALAATFMISKYVAVNETAGEIKSLTNELNDTRAYTSQRIFEMERTIDLGEVEEIATTRLGMQRPESYQIVYVNVEKEDVSEVTAGDVEGAGNDVKAFWTNVKKNIMELFGIN